jgi:hypothetical protein
MSEPLLHQVFGSTTLASAARGELLRSEGPSRNCYEIIGQRGMIVQYLIDFMGSVLLVTWTPNITIV